MSELAKKAREERAAKAKRYSRTHDEGKVDASDFKQAEPLEAEAKTGLRPISRRQFKRGGKVEGEHAHHHAGRKPRKSGGKALTADSLLNRDMKEANEGRAGTKHVGGMKRGGKAMKHDDVAEDKKLIKSIVKRGAIKPGMAKGGLIFKKKDREECPECGGWGHQVHDPDEEGKILPCYHCGATGSVKVMPQGGSRRSIQKRERADLASAEQDRRGKAEYERRPQERRHASPDSYDEPLPGEISSRFKKGGSVHPKGCKCVKCCSGGMVKKKGGGSVTDGTLEGTRPTGGRKARKHGGRAKKTNINIVIAPHGGHQAPAGGMMPPPPPAGGLHQGMAPGMPPGMPPGGMRPPMPASPPPGGAPPMGAPPGLMGRKRGGRVHYPIKDGSGGGKGRLEKVKAYGLKPA